MAMNRKKILIVSMTAGSGHVSAAKSIMAYALSYMGDAKVEHVDFAKIINFSARFLNQHIYEWMVKKFPRLWGWYYNATNSNGPVFFISEKIAKTQVLFHKKVVDLVKEKNPDIIIFTNPMPAHFVSKEIRRIFGINIKMAVVITDYHTHRVYNIEGMDYYFVSCGLAKYDLVKAGVDKEKIFISGIPVNPRFYIKQDAGELRKKYGLDNGLPCVMFNSSGLPKATVKFVVSTLAEFKDKLNIILVTGGNKKLYNNFKKELSKGNFLVVNWTDVIDEYMEVSEVVIGKAGGLICSECMATNKKLIIVGTIPGVEHYNSEYMESNNFAEEAMSSKKLFSILSVISQGKKIEAHKNTIYKENPAKTVLETVRSCL